MFKVYFLVSRKVNSVQQKHVFERNFITHDPVMKLVVTDGSFYLCFNLAMKQHFEAGIHCQLQFRPRAL